MKKYILIAFIATSSLTTVHVAAQEMQGPKTDKKEQKMEKKVAKMERKEYNGSDRKASKKKLKAIKKGDKMEMKDEQGK